MDRRIVNLGCLIAMSAGMGEARETAIDITRSTVTVHVGKAGLFSAAGHEHWIDAPIASGVVDDAETRVEFRVETARMQVKPDPKIDAATQAEIQKDMQEMALESARYPEIEFRSTRVEKRADGTWSVTGTLSLHGVTRPVTVAVQRQNGAYQGRALLRQSEFGIKPIRAAGGLVKVKDELEINFRVVTRP